MLNTETGKRRRSGRNLSTRLKFRHLLEKHNIGEKIFTDIRDRLEESGLLMHGGTIVDATIISAPSSTKNRTGTRDPEMHQTKKGNQWYHGMKVHAGVDAGTGYIHTIEGTAANVHDSTEATIATSKIAVTLDNCSKRWYNVSQGDEKNGQNAAQCRVESSC